MSFSYRYCKCNGDTTTECGIPCQADYKFNEDTCNCEFIGTEPEDRCKNYGNGTLVCMDCFTVGMCIEDKSTQSGYIVKANSDCTTNEVSTVFV